MRHYETLRLLPVLAAAVLVAAWGPARAGSWEATGTASGTISYDDNPQLRPEIEDPVASTVAVVRAEAEFELREPAASYRIAPRVQARRFREDEYKLSDGEDYFLDADAAFTRPLLSWGVGFSYSYQNVLTFEDTSEGSGNFAAPNDIRQRIAISPNFSWTPTQRDSFTFGGSFSTVSYDIKFSPRADSEGFSGLASYQRTLTRRQSVGLTVNYYTSDADNFRAGIVCIAVDVDGSCLAVAPERSVTNTLATGFGISAVYNYALTELTNFTASFGRQETESDLERKSLDFPNDPLLNRADEFAFRSNQYRIGLDSRGERSEWAIFATRSVQPATNGSPADKTQLEGNFLYRLARNISVRVELLGYQQERISDFRIREDEFVRADLQLSWRFDDQWSLSAGYSFRNRDPRVQITGSDEGTTADELNNLRRRSNSIALSLRYRFDI